MIYREGLDYHMNLIDAAGITLPIPVLPGKIKIKSPGKNRTEEVLGLGEVVLARPRGLRLISWESYFPAVADRLTSRQLDRSPIESVRFIQNARDKLEPLKLQILGTDLDINFTVVVSSLEYEERGGAPGELYYTIELSEWREYRAIPLDLNQQNGVEELVENPTPRSGEPVPKETYTVRKGDSLWAISKRQCGDGSKWRAIYDLNRGTIGSNPNLIRPGQVLQLP